MYLRRHFNYICYLIINCNKLKIIPSHLELQIENHPFSLIANGEIPFPCDLQTHQKPMRGKRKTNKPKWTNNYNQQ